MAIRAETSFALKDSLFNAATIAELSQSLRAAWKRFDPKAFERRVLERFPELELKERIGWIVTVLEAALPADFDEARGILTGALPEPLDPTLEDDDFGQFIWVVPGEFIARHGCSEERLSSALEFLGESTKRFSAEGSVRPFLAAFPDETMEFVRRWATSDNYHVRRLASEGIRPLLPWAARVVLPTAEIISVLDLLHADGTRYVTRSVCNNLNDISKSDPDIVIETLERWRAEARQDPTELAWMTRHALRTLVKSDNKRALEMLGYTSEPDVSIADITATEEVVVGDAFEWACSLRSHARQRLKISLRIHFLKANGSLRPKVFAVKDVAVGDGDTVDVTKRQAFKPITTRVLYPGHHEAELVVNGRVLAWRSFVLLAP